MDSRVAHVLGNRMDALWHRSGTRALITHTLWLSGTSTVQLGNRYLYMNIDATNTRV